METPLISHPAPSQGSHRHPPAQTTDEGHLLLVAHGRIVAERATTLFNGPTRQEQNLWAAAVAHDFGKATPQFQKYIRPDETYSGPAAEKAHARLGALATWFILDRIGATARDQLAATLAVARHHQALPDTVSYTGRTLAEAFEGNVIRAQLDAINDTWSDAADEFFQMAIGDAEPESPMSWAAFYDWASSGIVVDELQALTTEAELTGRYPSTRNLPERVYDRTLHYWASLTLADKSHAMVIPDERLFNFETLDIETLDDYIEAVRSTSPTDGLEAELNDERERARRQTIRGVHEWLETSDSSIATLTLPTGLGKTFTGLSAGFTARDILDEKVPRGHPRPIVYALPYTSIIEQTREIFEDPNLWAANPEKSALTVHHYLSETVVIHGDHSEDDSDDTDQEHAGLLGESWRDGTILTTFVQLFESLTGPSNRQGLKLPSLDSGLIILDEPQAIPKGWWDAVPRILQTLTDELDARLISMTATQPSVLRELETTSLLKAGRRHDTTTCQRCHTRPRYATDLPPATEMDYFDRAERVRYTFDETALTHQLGIDSRYLGYDEAAEWIIDQTEKGSSTLAVCNTIKSSAQLTEVLCDTVNATHLGPLIETCLREADVDAAAPKLSPADLAERVLEAAEFSRSNDGESDQEWVPPEGNPLFVVTFNSRYRPFDRRILIRLAEILSTASVRFVFVSTQAVEAGVDLSFQTVFRDIAPLDSVVQVAGRCNRSYEWGRNGGEVIIWTLADPDEATPSTPTKKPPAKYIYERGTADSGIPGHLRLISDILADIGMERDIPDGEVSRHAVDAYFDVLAEKSLASTEIRDQMDDAEARCLSRHSLIGGYETVDVLVAVTGADIRRFNEITNAFSEYEGKGFEQLNEAAQLRVSIPVSTIEEVPNLTRIDARKRDEEGAQVFRYTNDAGLEYSLESGGLRGTGDTLAGRFTEI